MNMYHIEITKTVSELYTVKAENVEQAKDLVMRKQVIAPYNTIEEITYCGLKK